MTSLSARRPIRGASQRRSIAVLITLALAFAGCASSPPSRPLALDARVESEDGSVAVRIASEGWERSQDTPEPQPEREFLFRLENPDASTLLTAFRVIDTAPGLDDYVANRRSALLEAGAHDFREKRLFLGENQDLVASIARYRQSGAVILVVTAIRTPTVIEMTGITPRGHGSERKLLDIMESIEIHVREEK